MTSRWVNTDISLKKGKKENDIAELLRALHWLAVQRASKRISRYSDVDTLCSDDTSVMRNNL